MSADNPTSSDTPAARSEVLKSNLDGLLPGRQDVGLEGEYLWPVHPMGLALLYRASTEHSRAIHLKAEGAFGGGLIGDAAAKIEDLTERGVTELFTSLGIDLETYGNAFLQIIRSQDDTRVLELRRLPAITMSRFRGGFLQRVTLPSGDSKKITFTDKEIIHLRELCPEGRRYSLPSWISAEGMLELTWAATRFNAKFFKNGAIPEYAVIFKGPSPTKEMKADIQNFFRNDFQGLENAHRTLVLNHSEEHDLKFERLTADVKDGDFLKLMDAARDRIIVAHGVPPRILGIMTAGQLGGGGEVSGQLFVFEHLTLKPRRRRMLDQMRPLLKELGLRPGNGDDILEANQIAFRALDLTPPKDDAENLPELVQAGIVSEAEARALLPYLQTISAGASESRSEAPQNGISKSAAANPIEALAALLGRL